MSGFSYKQTLAGLKTTSALHPGADLSGGPPLKVKLTSVAESCLASIARGTPGRVPSTCCHPRAMRVNASPIQQSAQTNPLGSNPTAGDVSNWYGSVRIEPTHTSRRVATCVGERLVEPLVVLEVQVRADRGSNHSAHHVLMSVFKQASEYEAQPTIVSPVTTTG